MAPICIDRVYLDMAVSYARRASPLQSGSKLRVAIQKKKKKKWSHIRLEHQSYQYHSITTSKKLSHAQYLGSNCDHPLKQCASIHRHLDRGLDFKDKTQQMDFGYQSNFNQPKELPEFYGQRQSTENPHARHNYAIYFVKPKRHPANLQKKSKREPIAS